MKPKILTSLTMAFTVGCFLLFGLPALAQDLNQNGNVNLISTDPVNAPFQFSFQIDGRNAIRMKPDQNGSFTSLFVGRSAGASTVSAGNTFVGSFAGFKNTSGNWNTFFGYQSGYSSTLGAQNTFTGGFTGYSNTVGGYNVFDGYYAGYSNVSGRENTFLGYFAGGSNTTGTRNVLIGMQTGSNNIRTGSHNIYIASYGSQGPTTDESNTLRIGVPYQGCYNGCGINAAYIAGIYGATITSGKLVCIDSTGKLGTSCTISLAAQEDTIRSQAQRIEDLELRLSRLEALAAQK